MKLFDVYPLYDVEPVKALGARVWDASGTEYLDFYGGHAVISIGHAHPHYVKLISEQLSKLGFYSNSVINSLQQELADKLGEVSGLSHYQLFLINSGAEANENALKMASFHNGRTKVVAFKKAFHGRTSAAVNVTPDPKLVAPINATFERVFLDFEDFEALETTLKKGDIAAVIIEGIQGIGGIHTPSGLFLKTIQDLCHQTQTVFILDEIQSGYGRSGQFFAYQKFPCLEPDIVTMAKGMGNGFPIGGVLIHPKFKPKHGLLGTTFGGNHLACAAAIAVLDVLVEEKLLLNAQNVGRYAIGELKKLSGVKEVRGEGLMLGVEFEFPTAALRKRLVFEHRVFVGSSSEPQTVRLLPPLNITKADVDILVKKMQLALHQEQVLV
jgi:acetylornithine/N-succinyldiaminopimelate aminotransferase